MTDPDTGEAKPDQDAPEGVHGWLLSGDAANAWQMYRELVGSV